MRRYRHLWWIAAVGLTFAAGWASAQLGDVLKAGGIVLLVDRFGGEINDGINNLLFQNSIRVKHATKVVPIFSLGQGTHVGAAQVGGPEDLVQKVKGVAQLEGRFLGRRVRAKVLVPVSSIKPGRLDIDRVEGVGVSAVLEIKL